MIVSKGSIWKHLGGHVGQTRAAHNSSHLKQVCHLQISIQQHGGAINANPSSSGHDDNDSHSNKPTELAQTVTFLTFTIASNLGRGTGYPHLRFLVDFF